MGKYKVRTDRDEKKTYIVDTENEGNAYLIYTDFVLRPKFRDISKEDIVTENWKKRVGKIILRNGDDTFTINKKRRELCGIDQDLQYRELGNPITYKRQIRDVLLSRPEYENMDDDGLSHAYFFEDASELSSVFCYEKDGNVSGLINTKNEDRDSMLKGLPFVLLKRIDDQEYLFDFMKK